VNKVAPYLNPTLNDDIEVFVNVRLKDRAPNIYKDEIDENY